MSKNPFETGILTVITQNIFFFINASLFFMISVLPAALWFLFLERSLLDLLFIFLAGPAISAICRFMIAYIETDFSKDDYPGLNDYLVYYRRNFKESLTYWIPYCILMFILLTNLDAYQWGSYLMGLVMSGVYLAIIGVVTLIVGYFFLISAKFKFKLNDLFRLSIYHIFVELKATLGILAVLILTLVGIFFVNEFLILVFSGPLIYILVRYGYAVVENVGKHFVSQE